MPTDDRRAREREARHRLITATARDIAEREGWDAVTTRRLSAEIDYSQPVIYRHFASMEAVAQAVAVEGFAALAQTLRSERDRGGDPEATLGRVAHAYADFARDNSAVYDAMFTRSTRLPFAAADVPEPLVAAFAELRHAVAALTPGPEIESRTEVLWAALHGLATLTRTNRLRPDGEAERLRHLVAAFRGG